MKDMLRNGSGYIDLTAYHGTKNVIRAEIEMERDVNRLIGIIKETAELAGFHIENRIVIRHVASGRIYK